PKSVAGPARVVPASRPHGHAASVARGGRIVHASGNMRRQLGLFGADRPAFDATFTDARRLDLDAGAWNEHVPGWVRGADALFESLERGMRWRSETQHLYDKVVDTPRLLARVPDDGPGHPLLEELRAALDARYGEGFVRLSMALYRD